MIEATITIKIKATGDNAEQEDACDPGEVVQAFIDEYLMPASVYLNSPDDGEEICYDVDDAEFTITS